MQEYMVIWFSFNMVFGLWSLRNYLTMVVGFLTGRGYRQNTLGKFIDLVVLSSCLSQYLIYTGAFKQFYLAIHTASYFGGGVVEYTNSGKLIKENEMDIKIEWPNGLVTDLNTATVKQDVVSCAVQNVMVLSMTYDVIIDCGVVTFVEKS